LFRTSNQILKMKHVVGLVLCLCFLCHMSIAQESRKERQAREQFEMSQLIDGGKFRFVAKSAHSNLGNFNHLSSGYEMVFDSLKISSYLPYYGRAYSVDYGGSGGVKFILTAEDIEKNWNEKKKLYTLKVELNDLKDSYSISLTISLNGFADLRISFSNRQLISYYGTIKPIITEVEN